MSAAAERAVYLLRQNQRCGHCGLPRWKHSKWASETSRREVKRGGCRIDRFVDPKEDAMTQP